jgi:8-oxo-dGTP diphosphatase
MTTKLPPEVVRQHKGVSFVGITTWFLCHDGSGEFVLAKRGKNARDEHGRWEIGGGGLKVGATAEENVRREVKEEYGADATSINFLGYRDLFRKLDDGTPTHWLALDFSVRVDRTQIKNNEPETFDEVGWFTLENLPAPLHSQWPIYFKKYEKTIRQILDGQG